MCDRRRPAYDRLCPCCAGRLLLGSICAVLRDDPNHQLALALLGIAARLARLEHAALPVELPDRPEGWATPLPPWLRARFAPLLAAAAAGLAGEADDLRVAADDELQQLKRAYADERAKMLADQLGGGRRGRA